MTRLSLLIHRSAEEIGGNCIEITLGDSERILLDIGRPLDASRGAKHLLPGSLDLARPVSGILISHPHQDHYGLLEEIPRHWPIYSGRATWKLIQLTAGIFGSRLEQDCHHWKTGHPFSIESFRITPYLTDHSAFDAYMLLIEVAGKRILYSGDFRMHGRKSDLVKRMMECPPPNIDILLMEGTNLGTDKPTKSESDLEDEFIDLFEETAGRVFVSWSAQNIDRTVTLYRACKQSKRTLVVDLYTAEVLDLLAQEARLPQPGWDNIKVVITKAFRDLYARKGRQDFVERMAQHGLSAAQLTSHRNRWVIMVRPSLIQNFTKKGVVPDVNDAWSYSQWHGYLQESEGQVLQAWFESGEAKAKHIHTSGHASPQDLHNFVKAINPTALVPIHGVAWDEHRDKFGSVVRLHDGSPLLI